MQLFDDVLGLAGVLALLLDLVAGVHYGGMVAATKVLSNFRQTVLSEFFSEVHGNLAWTSYVGRTTLGVHIGHFDFVLIRNSFLNILNCD